MEVDLAGRIAARARRFGPLRWSQFMEAALYEPAGGFYQTTGRAGRSGDFVTSPELGPLFACVVARVLDRYWEELGRPDPYVVVEAAAGAGTLARDVLGARPACSPALRYVLVERSARLRQVQGERLTLEHPALVLGPSRPNRDPDDDRAARVPGTGPLVTSLAELPAFPVTGVVLANELLDNLPVDLLEWRGGRWHDVLVADSEGELIELLVPAPPERAVQADRLIRALPSAIPGKDSAADGGPPVAGPGALAEGTRIPLQGAARQWVEQARALVEDGRLVVIDYADTTPALAAAPPAKWLRTFRNHQAAPFPILKNPGGQDITCVVAVDQLPVPDRDQSQADWLAGNGLLELVAAARATWKQRAATGDLAAMAARSRVLEADALIDPTGLGGHRVLEWRTQRH
ncbi:MAG: SAM-dependent methyltransferase [Acidimicrobiales bacterium]